MTDVILVGDSRSYGVFSQLQAHNWPLVRFDWHGDAYQRAATGFDPFS
jgi:hypothetical protein